VYLLFWRWVCSSLRVCERVRGKTLRTRLSRPLALASTGGSHSSRLAVTSWGLRAPRRLLAGTESGTARHAAGGGAGGGTG
jgi:hypothetical protein